MKQFWKDFAVAYVALSACLAAAVGAQQLVAVAPETSGGSWVGLLMIPAAIAAFLVWAKIKKPELYAKVMRQAKAVEEKVASRAQKISVPTAPPPILVPTPFPITQPQEQPEMLTPEQFKPLAQMVSAILAPQIIEAIKREVRAEVAKLPKPEAADQSAVIAQLVEKLHQSTPTVSPPAPIVEAAPVPIVAAPAAPTKSPLADADYIYVRPTGATVARRYPSPQSGEGVFTYASRIQSMISPDNGKSYLPPVMWGTSIFSPAMGAKAPYSGANEAETFDSVMHPDDWKTSADAAREANLKASEARRSETLVMGPLPLHALTDDDCAFLVAMGERMTFDPRYLSQGTITAVSSRLGVDTYQSMVDFRFNPASNLGKVSAAVWTAVRDLAAGATAPWCMTALGPAYIEQRKQGWHDTWKQAFGFEP